MEDAGEGSGGGGFFFFSGVWPRLREAWRRRRGVSGEEEEEEEESVRGRLERRAAAARRVGRKLLVVALNLEALVFIYAFWRARRRNLSWRRPVQALPMFVIPASATIIYTAFVRFTRMLDLRDKKMLERLQEEKQAKNGELKESSHNVQKNIENYDDVDLADNSVTATDSVIVAAKLGKRPRSNVHVRDEFRSDTSWGHSKDFQPVQSDGLQYRKLLSGRKNVTSTFSQPIDRLFKHLANDSDYIVPNERITEHDGNFGTEFEEHEIAYSTANNGTNPYLPGCSNSQMNSNAMSCTEYSPLVSPSKILGELDEEDALPQLKQQEMAFSSVKDIFPSPSDSKSVHNDSNNLLYVASNAEVSPSTKSEVLTAGGGEEKIPTDEMRSFEFGNEISAYPLDGSNAHRIPNNLSSILSDLVANHLGAFEELPAESDEEKLLTVSLNDGIASSSDKEISTSPSDCNEDCSESSNSSPISGSSVPSKMYQELPARDGNEEASAVSPQSDMREDTSISIEDITRSPSDCNHSRPVISSMVTDVSTIYEELPAGGGEEEAFGGPLEHENTASSGKETPTSPVDSDNSHSGTNDSSCAESSLPVYLSAVFRELLVKVGEEKSLTGLQPPEKHAVSPAVIKEAPASPLDYSIAHGSSNDLSSNASSPVLAASETFEELLAESGKEEALVGSEQPMGQQMNSYTSDEKTPMSQCVFNNEQMANPPACDNAHNDVNNLSFITVFHELNFPAFPELLAEGGEKEQSSELHRSEEHELSFSLEEEASTCPDEVNSAEHCSKNSGFSSCIQESNMMEVPGGVKEGLCESKDERAFSFEKETFTSSDDVSNAENFTKTSTSAQFIPEANMTEALQGGEEVSSETLHENTFCFAGTLISPDVVNDVEIYSNNSSSCILEANMMEVLLGGQEETSESRDEKACTFEKETSISPDQVYNAENYTNNSMSSQCIPEANDVENLQGGKKASSESLHKTAFSFEETFISPNEGINSEKYSLYSRSSSCVSEANMMEALGGGQEASSEPVDENVFSFEEKTSMSPEEVRNAENYANNLWSAEYIPEANMMETLQGGEEALSGSLHDSTFNFEETSISPDEGNSMENYSDYPPPSSFILDANVTKSLQAGQEGSSERQYGNDFTFEETPISPKEVNNAENYLNNSGPAQYITDLSNTIESLQDGGKASYESLHENAFSPDEGIDAENYSDNPRSCSCIPEANLIEAPQGGQEGSSEPHDENVLSFEETSKSCEEVSNAENHLNNPWSVLYIPDANTVESLQGGEEESSESLHENTFSIEVTSISPDKGKNAENYSNNSGSVLCIQEINMTGALPGDQEGSSESQDEKAFTFEETSISPNEVDNAETNDSKPAHCIPEANMMETQGVEKASSKSQHEDSFNFEETLVRPDVGNNAENYSEYSRSSSCIAEENVIEALESGQEGSSEPQDDNAFSFEETSTSPEEVRNAENSSNNSKSAKCILETSTKEAIGGALKGSSEPLHEKIHSFQETSISQDEVYESLHEKTPNFEETSIPQDEVNNAENYSNNSRSSSRTPKADRIKALQSGEKGLFESRQPEEQGMAVNPAVTPIFLDEGRDAQNGSSNSSSVSCNPEVSVVDTPSELLATASAGNEKVALEDKRALETLSTDEQDKSNEFEDTTDDAEDLVENNLIDPLEVADAAPAPASKPSVKFYAKDNYWRDSAMGASNDFEATRVAGLRQRKPVFTSTMSEPAGEQSTKPADDDAQTFDAPLPSPGVTNTENRLNDLNSTARISVECSTTPEPPRKSI